MTDVNPYSPPKANLVGAATAGQDMWHDGKTLVMRPETEFPRRCIKCNEASVEPVRRCNLTWHSPWYYLLILVNILIYIVVALAVRKSAKVYVGLCARHQKWVLMGRIVGWGGFAVLALMLVFAITAPMPGLMVIALILFLPWLIAAIVLNRLLVAVRIDSDLIKAKGCSVAFLESLPVHPGVV